MNDLAELEALLEERDRIDKQIADIRLRLEAALARINGAVAHPAATNGSAVSASTPPAPPIYEPDAGPDEDKCVYFDCEKPVSSKNSVYCRAHLT